MTTITCRRSPFHILSHGRRVAKRDEDLFRLIEFANVLTPRGGESAKDSLEIRVTNFLGDPLKLLELQGSFEEHFESAAGSLRGELRALWEAGASGRIKSGELLDKLHTLITEGASQHIKPEELLNELRALWEDVVDDRIEPDKQLLDKLHAIWKEGSSERSPGKLLDELRAIWAEAAKRFPHPTIPLAVAIPSIDPPIECESSIDFAWQVLIVRRIVWDTVSAASQSRHYFSPGTHRVRLPGPTIQVRDGRLEVVENLSGALLEVLKRVDLRRVDMCDVAYRRTDSSCRRLFLALRHDQKECSPECADLRRHNEKRPKSTR